MVNSGPSKPTLDTTTHKLLEFRYPGEAIVELRKELLKPHNKDLFVSASQHKTFETCMAQIAADLFIVVDGYYDADKLAARLVEAIRMRAQLVMLPTSGLAS